MELETLANHISELGMRDFDNVCQIILTDIFGKRAINVNGRNDGGTDMISINDQGQRETVAYQITVQRSNLNNKLLHDAERAIEKLSTNKFYFFSKFHLDQISRTKKEDEFSTKLGIPIAWYSCDIMAGLLLSEPYALNKFIESETNLLPIGFTPKKEYDFRERALYSYTTISDDALSLKLSIYDETLLMLLYEKGTMTEEELVAQTHGVLSFEDDKTDILKKRIGALFGKAKLIRNEDKSISIAEKVSKDIANRQILYATELNNLVSSQVDLLQTDYQIEWTIDDSRKVAVWIANAYISDKLKVLKEVKASLINNQILKVEEQGLDKIIKYLHKDKKIDKTVCLEIAGKLIELASNHPLILKLSRASVAIALQGSSPIASAKAIGVNRWNEVNIMIEPTIAIPYICSGLYEEDANKFVKTCSKVISRAKKLNTQLWIPHFYINECAGHLIEARKYDGISLNEDELQYSKNAYVANYFSLKKKGVALPATFMEYLRTFSPSIMVEREDKQDWARVIMIDIQEKLTSLGINFIETPFITEDECKDFQNQYSLYQDQANYRSDKPRHLVNHDIWALTFTNQQKINRDKTWFILTFDRALIHIGRTEIYKGWVCDPYNFLSLSDYNQYYSEDQFASLAHSFASSSERTLSLGARIIDKIIQYAANKMQNWQFIQDINNFKKELLASLNFDDNDIETKIDTKTNTFLKNKGINVDQEEINTSSPKNN